MASSRRTRYYRKQKSGRFMWDQVALGPIAVAAGVNVVTNLLAAFGQPVLVGAVIKRIVGNYGVRSASDDLDAEVKLAIYTQRQEAFAAGVSPELEDDEYNYMWTDSVYLHTGSLATQGQSMINRPIDVKVSRKLRSLEDIILVFNRENTSAVSAVQIMAQLRVLLWIP